jgi:hypothetical protein
MDSEETLEFETLLDRDVEQRSPLFVPININDILLIQMSFLVALLIYLILPSSTSSSPWGNQKKYYDKFLFWVLLHIMFTFTHTIITLIMRKEFRKMFYNGYLEFYRQTKFWVNFLLMIPFLMNTIILLFIAIWPNELYLRSQPPFFMALCTTVLEMGLMVSCMIKLKSKNTLISIIMTSILHLEMVRIYTKI